ncbi:hypothetical protein NDU88_006867 [Pleurodeles waltl]|uniref:Uncharacterized protein n=1 Tax=Pleurodeles waltl TaxID=8319 RepID=A0AAV7TZT0_PLEWA|nr:hypothetical protein NDU88_006867 [Pleurodeles waltl]
MAITLPPTPELCLLGIGPCPKNRKQSLRCKALALVMYRRLIVMHGKALVAPGIDLWRAELLRWAKAEAQTLHLLLARGIPVKGLNSWNSFVTAIESKDDERPP